jgi:hypothetical protein
MTSTVRLLLTIDTEEDNWLPTRDGITVENIRAVPRLQSIFDRYGVRPTYLTTYQVAIVPWAAEVLRQIADSGAAEIGTHLHPWNTPPFEEEVDEWTVGWKNLPEDLQRRKLETVTQAVAASRGRQPTSFRSGRWSISGQALGLLPAAGYRTDSSVLPYYYWYDVVDGPSFPSAPVVPYFPAPAGDIQREGPIGGPIVEIPATVGYRRWPWRGQALVDRLLRSPVPRRLRLSGLAARLGLADRIALSHELSTDEELRQLTDVAIRHGVGTLNLFLHSNVLRPGATSYTASAADVDAFLRRIEVWLDYLFGTAKVEPMTMSEAGERFRTAPGR